MATTTAADLAAGAIAMVAEARFTIQHQAVFIITVDKRSMGQGQKSMFVPKFGTVVCEDLMDGVEIPNSQTLTLSGTTHTTDEVGAIVVITKKLRQQLTADAFRVGGKVLGEGMQKKLDESGLSLFSGLNSGLSNANTSFSVGYLAAAITQCLGQSEPCPPPLSCVAHPYLLHPLIDAISAPGTSNMPPAFQDEVLRQHFMGLDKLYGIPIFRSGNATIDSSSDSYGAVYSKSAFIYITGYEIENWVVYKERLRGWEIGIVHDYAMVEEDGAYGRFLLFDATAPTS